MHKPTKKQNLFGSLFRNTRAVSPLVAVLLLVTIAVAASIVTHTWLMSMIAGQQQQSQTQVRIDMLEWHLSNSGVSLTVRNTGTVTADIESISIRLNTAGAEWYIDESEDAKGAFNSGATMTLTWTEEDSGAPSGFLTYSTSYVIRVTATTGFYYELVDTTPSS